MPCLECHVTVHGNKQANKRNPHFSAVATSQLQTLVFPISFQIANQFSFIHPTEEALLNRICRLATHYFGFVKFLGTNGQLPHKGIFNPPYMIV